MTRICCTSWKNSHADDNYLEEYELYYFRRISNSTCMFLLVVVLLFILAVLMYVRQPKFGSIPVGERLQRLQNSPHYSAGSFQNLNVTPNFTEGSGYVTVMREVLFGKDARATPAGVLPSVKTDLHALRPDENVLVWFGHSSYFLQVDGKRILVDPVLSGAASPLRFTMPSFAGTDIYTVADFPDLDYLFLSHDHWDHLDYTTIVGLKPKVGKVICSLGVGAHLERWGYTLSGILEKDWNETVLLDDGFTVHTVPARHFSGRGFVRNRALWTAYVLQTPSLRLFLGGDSGYDTHFVEIGATYGPFDLVMLECGQYNRNWKYIHMMPEEVVQAARELRAKRLFPVHWGKFPLAMHAWDEPILRVTAAAKNAGMPLVHPMIGEQVNLTNEEQVFSEWWVGIR